MTDNEPATGASPGSAPGGALASAAPLVTAGDPTPQARPRRRWRVLAGVVVTVLVLGGAYLAAYLYAGTTVPAGTTVLGIDIGGLTAQEAEDKLLVELPPIADAEMTLLVADADYTIVPSESGLNVDVAATVRAAGPGASDPLRLAESIVAGGGPVDPVVVVDEEALQSTVDEVADDADREPVEGAVDFTGGNVTATLPQQGRLVDRAASVDEIADSYLVVTGPVVLPTTTTDPTLTETEVQRAVTEFAEPAMSAPVPLRSDIGSAELATSLLGGVLTMEADEAGTLQLVLDEEGLLEASQDQLDALGRPATDAAVAIRNGTPTVIPSSTGQEPDTSTYGDDVLAALTATGEQRVVTLALQSRPADFTTEDAENAGVREVVAEFTTSYPHADYRNTNIGRAAELANNTFLKPGDVFSMNGSVGERTEARGFTSGFIIENGRFAEADGGGVSQLATTLFNAGHFAGFSDVEHHPHTLYLDRYPPGREATVFWGSLDLRFGNNTPYGAVVQSFITPSSPGTRGSVTVRIWSTPYWEVDSATGAPFNSRPFEQQRISGPDCVPSSGSNGFDIVVTRTLSRDGAVQQREEIFTRYEPTPEVVCTG
jgi:vancomycin resistance protein YoaR